MYCRNPFLFRGPIPTALVAAVAVSIIGRNPFLFRGPIPTTTANIQFYSLIQSQSLLIQRSYSYKEEMIEKGKKPLVCRNPFLFRGPIPTKKK